MVSGLDYLVIWNCADLPKVELFTDPKKAQECADLHYQGRVVPMKKQRDGSYRVVEARKCKPKR